MLKIEGAPATAGTSEPKKVELPPLAPLLAKADVQDGEKYTHKVCVACHTFNKGGKAGVGPNLYGIVGAKHGHMAGFNYSNAIKEKKGAVELCRAERVAAQAKLLRARHAHGLRRHQQCADRVPT